MRTVFRPGECVRDAPSAKRLADSLRQELIDQQVVRFYTSWRKLQKSAWPTKLPGRRIVEVESLSKNVLFHLEGDVVLYSALSPWGRWEVGARRGRVGRDARINVMLTTQSRRALLYQGQICEILPRAALPMHPYIGCLGPDVMSEPFDRQRFLTCLGQRRNAMREIADVLLDQQIIAGLGNALKCEVLFAARISPFCLTAHLRAEPLTRLCKGVEEICQRAYRFNGRTAMDHEMRQPRNGDGQEANGLGAFVYARAGFPCCRCGAAIERRRHGIQARLTFYCPQCQPHHPILA